MTRRPARRHQLAPASALHVQASCTPAAAPRAPARAGELVGLVEWLQAQRYDLTEHGACGHPELHAFVRWVTETLWGLDSAPTAYREIAAQEATP